SSSGYNRNLQALNMLFMQLLCNHLRYVFSFIPPLKRWVFSLTCDKREFPDVIRKADICKKMGREIP
ncbi:MAG: hypothetical protein M1327_00005, partial [Candidatus Thermoplasmatota archaeon]|nr:hypothetical protein [Candidatus Thermoplasmatota archaeon]